MIGGMNVDEFIDALIGTSAGGVVCSETSVVIVVDGHMYEVAQVVEPTGVHRPLHLVAGRPLGRVDAG